MGEGDNQCFGFGSELDQDSIRSTQAADPLNVMIPAARLDIRKNFFSVRVCDKWNSLPSEIKNSANVKIFKTSYRRHTSTCPPQATDEQTRNDMQWTGRDWTGHSPNGPIGPMGITSQDSRMDLVWIRIRIQEGKTDQQKRTNVRKVHKGGAGCSFLRAEGFSCCLNVLYGGLEMT